MFQCDGPLQDLQSTFIYTASVELQNNLIIQTGSCCVHCGSQDAALECGRHVGRPESSGKDVDAQSRARASRYLVLTGEARVRSECQSFHSGSL